MHNFGVAFETGNEGRFGQSTLPVVLVVRACYADTLCGVFTSENFWAGTRITVITSCIVTKPLGRHVVVLVNQVGFQLTHLLPQEVEALAIRRRSGAGDEGDVWILLLESFREHFITLDI